MFDSKQRSDHGTPAPHGEVFTKLKMPAALALLAAASLAGCSLRRPEAEAHFDADPKVQPITLVADGTSSGPHFRFSSLGAKFGKAGEYKVVDGIAGKTWSVSVGKDDIGKDYKLSYDNRVFWCTRDQGVYPITIVRGDTNGGSQVVTTYLHPALVK